MRKILMLLVVGCLGISTGQASSLFLQDGKSTPIRKGENGPCSHGRPAPPAILQPSKSGMSQA